MRLITRKIYRAFPELDPYTDDRCQRFVLAATKFSPRRLFHAALVLTAFGVGAIVAMVLMGRASNFLERRLRGSDTQLEIAVLLTAVLIFAIPPIAAYITRDAILSRRLRHVLRTRGLCINCGYALIGLPVDEHSKVVCAECGTKAEVDPSLGELELDEAGRRHFKPHEPQFVRARWFTPVRVARIKKTAKCLAVLLPLCLLITAVGYEVYIRFQVSVARADRPGSSGMLAHVEQGQRPNSAGKGDAWEMLTRISAARNAVETDVRDRKLVPIPDDIEIFPEFSFIYHRLPARSDDDESLEAKQEKLAAELARVLLAEYKTAGLYEQLAEMAACQSAVRSETANPLQPVMFTRGWTRAEAYRLSTMNAARMHVALKAQDFPEFLRATEANFALVRMFEHQGTFADRESARFIESETYPLLFAWLATHPANESIDAMDAAISRQSGAPSLTFSIEGERLLASDLIAWWFSDAERCRLGKYSSSARSGRIMWLSPKDPQSYRFGSYFENRKKLNDIFDAAVKAASLHRVDRATVFHPRTDLQLLDTFAQILPCVVDAEDQMITRRSGYPVLVALERFRRLHGDYPAQLSELVPAFLPEVPADPYCRDPLRYRRISARKDRPDAPEFMLYSVGADGNDDGGTPLPPGQNYMALRQSLNQPVDYIINMPDDAPSDEPQ